jgi:predicted phage baseplate assembly protein
VPPVSTLKVEVQELGGGSSVWREVPSFIHSDDSDENGSHYLVETDEDGLSNVRFGNGINGKELPEDAEVKCAYQIGNGPDGNIGFDKLINFDPAVDAFLRLEGNVLGPAADGSSIVRCWNPFDVTNGRAPEPAAEIIRRAPEAYRVRQLRAVTLQDYINRAEELPEVSKAAAHYAWTGSWRTVQVTIDPVGTTILTDEERRKIEKYLNAVRLIGEDLEIRAPEFVPVEIHVSLCAGSDYWPEDLLAYLEQEFSDGWTPGGRMGFFNPDLWTFGQQLKASQVIGRVLSVPGVEHVIQVRMKRFNDPGPFSDEITSVNYNEILQALNDPDHMEKGFIDFDVQGGRR